MKKFTICIAIIQVLVFDFQCAFATSGYTLNDFIEAGLSEIWAEEALQRANSSSDFYNFDRLMEFKQAGLSDFWAIEACQRASRYNESYDFNRLGEFKRAGLGDQHSIIACKKSSQESELYDFSNLAELINAGVSDHWAIEASKLSNELSITELIQLSNPNSNLQKRSDSQENEKNKRLKAY